MLTIRDAYSLPQIEESLDCLNGAKIFTSLHIKAGYWQVPLDEESIPLTAFTVWPLGFYECVRIPFRLTNAPMTFQRLMESCLGDLHLKYCIIYLDDIIIFLKTPKDQIEWLRKVFKKIDEAGLCLKPSKCEFFKKRIEYLRHIVSEDGIEMNPKKINDIINWPVPDTVTQLCSFLSFCNYYWKFIRDYVKISHILYKQISGDNTKKKGNKNNWTQECQEAFDKLKKVCSETLVLAYADYMKPFKVHIDASEHGLGAVLYQDQDDGTTSIIAFASCSLSNTKAQYHSSKLEFFSAQMEHL